MDKRDIALQLQIPITPVPLFSELPSFDQLGDRLLIAANGVFLHSHRVWGKFVRKVGEMGLIVPFGKLDECSILHFGKLPMSMLREFAAAAKAASELEIGASVVWNQYSNNFRLVHSKSVEATGSSLRYERPPFGEGDHLVVDCHSHAHHRAGFSHTDDEDDKHEVKFSFVVGNCNSTMVSLALRLCVRGIFTNIPLPPLA